MYSNLNERFSANLIWTSLCIHEKSSNDLNWLTWAQNFHSFIITELRRAHCSIPFSVRILKITEHGICERVCMIEGVWVWVNGSQCLFHIRRHHGIIFLFVRLSFVFQFFAWIRFSSARILVMLFRGFSLTCHAKFGFQIKIRVYYFFSLYFCWMHVYCIHYTDTDTPPNRPTRTFWIIW